MQKIRSQKSLKNFYIRPTTGVGSKGAFSVEKRENTSNRDLKNINQLLQAHGNNNVLFQVNSYGFKSTQQQSNNNQDQQEQNMPLMTKSEALNSKTQTYPNSEYTVSKNVQDNFRILVKHKVFQGNTLSGNTQVKSRNNIQNNQNISQKNSPSQGQLQTQYRINKYNTQEEIRYQNPFSDEKKRDHVYSSRGGYSHIQSPSSQNANKFSNNQVAEKQPANNKEVPFEDDISEVKPQDSQKKDREYQNADNQREDDSFSESKEDNEQEQLSEIRIRENNNCEDSMNDIQELATSGFDLTAFREELQQTKSPKQKFISSLSQPQMSTISEKNQVTKTKLPIDSYDNSETNNTDAKRFSSLQKSQKNGSTNQYNFTQSKLSEQRDETIPSIHQGTASIQNFMNINNSKENNIQFINLNQQNQENKISRPITSQNNVSRANNIQMQIKQNNFKSTSNNFYELFANNYKQNNQNTYNNQLLSTIPLKQQSKIPFFHNYYRNEQIKNLQQSNTFFVKKAQIFSFSIKHNNLMSRQGQRKDSINSQPSNTIASQIQQQLVQGINNSNNKNKLLSIANTNLKQ
ncbi:hypothetical protein ABPG72_012508 [Tetrahymena utriculariae]